MRWLVLAALASLGATGCDADGSEVRDAARKTVVETPERPLLLAAVRESCIESKLVVGPRFDEDYEDGRYRFPVWLECSLHTPPALRPLVVADVVGSVALGVDDGEVAWTKLTLIPTAVSELPTLLDRARRGLDESRPEPGRGRALVDVRACAPRMAPGFTGAPDPGPWDDLFVHILDVARSAGGWNRPTLRAATFTARSTDGTAHPQLLRCRGPLCRLCWLDWAVDALSQPESGPQRLVRDDFAMGKPLVSTVVTEGVSERASALSINSWLVTGLKFAERPALLLAIAGTVAMFLFLGLVSMLLGLVLKIRHIFAGTVSVNTQVEAPTNVDTPVHIDLGPLSERLDRLEQTIERAIRRDDS